MNHRTRKVVGVTMECRRRLSAWFLCWEPRGAEATMELHSARDIFPLLHTIPDIPISTQQGHVCCEAKIDDLDSFSTWLMSPSNVSAQAHSGSLCPEARSRACMQRSPKHVRKGTTEMTITCYNWKAESQASNHDVPPSARGTRTRPPRPKHIAKLSQQVRQSPECQACR